LRHIVTGSGAIWQLWATPPPASSLRSTPNIFPSLLRHFSIIEQRFWYLVIPNTATQQSRNIIGPGQGFLLAQPCRSISREFFFGIQTPKSFFSRALKARALPRLAVAQHFSLSFCAYVTVARRDLDIDQTTTTRDQ
jgi:hypothetical protein